MSYADLLPPWHATVTRMGEASIAESEALLQAMGVRLPVLATIVAPYWLAQRNYLPTTTACAFHGPMALNFRMNVPVRGS